MEVIVSPKKTAQKMSRNLWEFKHKNLTSQAQHNRWQNDIIWLQKSEEHDHSWWNMVFACFPWHV